MLPGESELEMAQRHVREGEAHIARQREIIAELLERRQPTEQAEKLLANFENLQEQHVSHLARLQDSN